jgi:hypothetical protein
MGGGRGKQQRVPIRCGGPHRIATDRATGAGAVLHHHRQTFLTHSGGEQARSHVG